MSLVKALIIFAAIIFCQSVLAQKQLLIIKKGKVQAHFNEGDYIRFVLKKKHEHAEGHIIELYDFHMITSNDTVKFKDILKVNVKKHRAAARWNGGVGGLLFAGGLVYLAVDQLNVAIGVNEKSSPAEVYVPLIVSGLGAAMVGIRPKYRRINGIQYLRSVDYKSPFYQFK